jgi:hypothetical protein
MQRACRDPVVSSTRAGLGPLWMPQLYRSAGQLSSVLTSIFGFWHREASAVNLAAARPDTAPRRRREAAPRSASG